MAANVLLRKTDDNAGPPTIAVAMLAPVETIIKWGSSKTTSVKVMTNYPFGDNATIAIRGAARLEVRIPGWADGATLRINGGPTIPAANGSMHPIDALSTTLTLVELFLRPTLRVEKGWGRSARNGPPLILYSSSGACVPSAHELDWQLDAERLHEPPPFSTAQVRSMHHERHNPHGQPKLTGCAFEPSLDMHFSADLRSGDPGTVTTAVLATPIWGAESQSAKMAHSISSVELTFRYVAGYGSSGGSQKGATLSIVLIDAATQDVVSTLYTSPPLVNYSFDDFKGYSPPIHVHVSELQILNGRALHMALRFHNNDRNVQVSLI